MRMQDCCTRFHSTLASDQGAWAKGEQALTRFGPVPAEPSPVHPAILRPILARLRLASLVVAIALLTLSARASDDPFAAEDAARLRAGQALLSSAHAPATGDLAAMRQRGVIRVLVDWNRTSFFIENGQPRGLAYELMNAFGEWLNAREGRDDHRAPKLRILFVPMEFPDILPALVAGRGDLAAANLTVTEARARQVAFTRPYVTDVSEIIVSHKGAPPLASLDDLAGHTLFVQRGSAELESVTALSQRLVAAGRPAINIQLPPGQLELEDMLEMANSGAVDFVAVDSHIAALWAHVLPNLELRNDLTLATDRMIAGAVRHESVELKAALDAFIDEQGARHRAGAGDLIRRSYTNSH